MSLTVDKFPEDIVLSGNPIEIKVTADTTGVSFHKIHVRIIKGSDIIGEDSLPVIENSVTFDVSDYLKIDENINFHIVGFFQLGLIQTNFTETFHFEIFETYNSDGTEHHGFSRLLIYRIFKYELHPEKLFSCCPTMKIYNFYRVPFFPK